VQSGVQAHTPWALHTSGRVQVPHTPPQPSGPQFLPVQSGVQIGWQRPLALQNSFAPQVPHETPHRGSGPH
jgi:hypothetical protein